MEKKIIYLQNILFLLFDKYIGSPKEIGAKVGGAIITAVSILYPKRKNDFECSVDSNRKKWFEEFRNELINRLNIDSKY